jgi:hypothetical protein
MSGKYNLKDDIVKVEPEDETGGEADDIAQKLLSMLHQAFENREGREPSGDEMMNMMEELTEERIQVLMGEKGSADAAIEKDEPGKEEEEEKEEVSVRPSDSNECEPSVRSPPRKIQRTDKTDDENDCENAQQVEAPPLNPFGF